MPTNWVKAAKTKKQQKCKEKAWSRSKILVSTGKDPGWGDKNLIKKGDAVPKKKIEKKYALIMHIAKKIAGKHCGTNESDEQLEEIFFEMYVKDILGTILNE